MGVPNELPANLHFTQTLHNQTHHVQATSKRKNYTVHDIQLFTPKEPSFVDLGLA
jgi:hypothetical protein